MLFATDSSRNMRENQYRVCVNANTMSATLARTVPARMKGLRRPCGNWSGDDDTTATRHVESGIRTRNIIDITTSW